MKIKMKNALIFGGFILLNSLVADAILDKGLFSKNFVSNIISVLIVAVAGGYIFGFILKGSFGWKNKKEEIKK